MFPMLVRDVLLTLADHEFFTPKWSPQIREEWMRNLVGRFQTKGGLSEIDAQARVSRIATAVANAFPNAEVTKTIPESPQFDPVDVKDRHVAMTALACNAEAIVTFNTSDFAAEHLYTEVQIEVIHPDDFVIDLITLDEKRAVVAFRELRARKKNPMWDASELARRLGDSGLMQTALWVRNPDVSALI